MKVDQNQVAISGDLVYVENTPMEVDPAAGAMVLKALIDQYSNPTAAVLRELTSNAWDSHVEAGQTRPVEVSLPSALSPHFIVEDFGIGMSRDGMKQFGQFGHSSKRDTDDLIGSWGMGSKSPLAISSEYTVVGVKDGFRNVCVVGRQSDGSPYMGFVNAEPVPTDLPNGVKITVPYSDPRPFTEAIKRGMFRGWLPGTISIDGVLNTTEDSIHTNTELFSVVENFGWSLSNARNSELGAAFVGPVLFPIRWDAVYDMAELEALTPILDRTILNLPIGTVSMPSNRESLVYSPKTVAMIRKQMDGIIEIGARRWQEGVSKAATMRDAWRVVVDANKTGYVGPFSYKGVTLVLPNYPAPAQGVGGSYLTSGYVDPSFGEGVPIERNNHPMWDMNNVRYAVLGYYAILVTESGPTLSKMKTRYGSYRPIHTPSKDTRSFMHGLVLADGFTFPDAPEGHYPKVQGVQVFYATESRTELGAAFLGMFNKTLTLDEFKAYARTYRSKKAKEARARSVSGGTPAVVEKTYLVRELVLRDYGASTWEEEVSIKDLDKTHTYVLLQNSTSDYAEEAMKSAFMTKAGYRRYGGLSDTRHDIRKAFPNLHVLYLYKNENRKVYEQALPNILSATGLYEKVTEHHFSEITEEQVQMEAIRISSGYNYWINKTRAVLFDDIDNPDTRQLFLDIKGASSDTREVFQSVKRLQSCLTTLHSGKADEYRKRLAEVVLPTNNDKNPLRRYPLLEHCSYAQPDYVIEYINLIDAKKSALESA